MGDINSLNVLVNILFYRLYDLQNMKVHLYAGDMNLSRNDEKENICRNAKI